MVVKLGLLMVVADWSDYWGLRLSRATRVAWVNGVVGPVQFGVYLRPRTDD
jgi:hypothetical protein